MNKIVLAQINTIAGDIKSNTQKIIECISRAKNDGVNLIIFPEYALVGFPYGDICERHKSIIKIQNEALEKIALETENITVVIGYLKKDKNLISAVSILQNGKIKKEASNFFELNGEKFGIIVSEDNLENNYLSFVDNVSTVIHCVCSPSRTGKEYKRNEQMSSFAKKYGINYIYVNKAGYGDNLSFDGASRVYDKKGAISARAGVFEEDFLVVENYMGKINSLPIGMEKEIKTDNFTCDYSSDLERTYKSIVFSIREYFSKNGFSKAVLGLSGGLDSSVASVLLADALGSQNVWGISMPSKITSKESKNDAKELAKNLGINFFEIPLPDAIDSMKSMLDFAFEKVATDRYEQSTTIENVQARIRATILWSVSNEHKGMLPIATSDKSEAYIGYATVNGDMSGGFAPIIDVTKTKLFALADYMNKNRILKNVIPQSVLEKPPGAELKINPKTGKTVCAEEDNMPYEFLDEIIWFVENYGYGFDDLLNHSFYYERKHCIPKEQKEEWISKFYWKSRCAVYKWHIIPPSVITDIHSINSVEYHHPILSKIY